MKNDTSYSKPGRTVAKIGGNNDKKQANNKLKNGMQNTFKKTLQMMEN